LADKFNPASRVAQVMEAAHHQNPSTPTRDAWAAAFGIEVEEQRRQVYEVNRTLELVSDEVDLLAEQVNSGVAGAPERCDDALNNARRAIAIIDFSPDFQQSKQFIHAHDINLLRILSDLTPDEERVDEDALSEVIDWLSDLRDYAVEHLEGAFRASVLRQIQIMEEAIRRYRFIGIKAFNEGVTLSFANFMQNQEVFRDATDEEAKSRLSELLRRFAALASETVVKGAQVVNAANTIKEITGN
jgi:hypothetical protein